YIIQHQDMKDPLQQTYRNIALGSEPFIERIKDKIEDLGRRREITSTRSISKYDVATIITKMTQVLNIDSKRLEFRSCNTKEGFKLEILGFLKLR
ncbi:unnamed protein product, partial [marine sediment metagenome]